MPARWSPARGNWRAGTKPAKGWRERAMRAPEPRRLDRDGLPLRFWEQMEGATLSCHPVHGREIVVLLGAPRAGFTYGCTPEDVTRLMGLVPAEDVAGIGCVAFRQPTRKEAMLAPVWGRMLFHAILPGYEGPCLMIEAASPGAGPRLGAGGGLEEARERDRLRADGHVVVGNRWLLREEAIRETILWRTVPHEIGHWADFNRLGGTAYWRRPAREREAWAHRYAESRIAALRADGLVPFRAAADA